MVVYMYIVPIHNGVSIATSKVQMPKTGQNNTKQYNGASDEMFVLHKMTSWVMVLMYFGLLLALITTLMGLTCNQKKGFKIT